MKKRPLFLVLIFSILAACADDKTHSENSVDISFPTGKKAVFAVCSYVDRGDSLTLVFAQIFSLQFDSTSSRNDTTYFYGDVDSYISPEFLNGPRFKQNRIPEMAMRTGEVVVSLDKKWVLFQYSDHPDAYQILLKNAPESDTPADTMRTPTFSFGQFPLYPSSFSIGDEFVAYRPASNSTGEYVAVSREFRFGGEVLHTDAFGNISGLLAEIDHHIFSTTLEFNSIVDSHGFAISSYSTEQILTTEDGAPIDTTTVRFINRRIVDFSAPGSVLSLENYAAQVIENGLIPVSTNEND